MRLTNKKNGLCTSGLDNYWWVFILVFVVTMAACSTLAGFCFDYVLDFWMKKDVPFVTDMIIGSLVSPVLVLATIVTFLVSVFG